MRRRGVLGGIAVMVTACYSSPALDLGPVPAGVQVRSSVTYYDVTAASLAEIRQGIRDEGPRSQGRRWGAVTRWRLNWTSQRATLSGSMCEIRHARVSVEVDIQFPRWNPTAQPDSALLSWWQQYNAGLAEHERGHAQLAVKGAGDIARALEGLHASCATLSTQASTLFRERVLALNTSQEQYDFTTRHGATQIQAIRRLTEPD